MYFLTFRYMSNYIAQLARHVWIVKSKQLHLGTHRFFLRKNDEPMNHKHNKQSEAKLCRVEFPDTNYLCTLPGHWWGLTCWNKSYLKLFGHQDHQPSFWVLLLEDFFDQPQRSRAARTWKSWWNDFLRCTSGPSKQKMPGCESFPVLSNRKRNMKLMLHFWATSHI